MRVDLRLVVPALCCWLVAALLVANPATARWWALTLWLVAGAAIGVLTVGDRSSGTRTRFGMRVRRSARTVGGMIAVCAATAAIAASAVAFAAPQRQPHELTLGSGTRVVEVVGTISDQPIAKRGGSTFGEPRHPIQFRASLSQVRAGNAVIGGSMPALVFAEAPSRPNQALNVGETFTLHGTLRSTAAEDSSAFMLFASGEPRVLSHAPLWLSWANTLRSDFSQAATALPGDGGRLLPGLAIGDVSAVTSELDTAMKLSSLSHLTAVSGANCAVVIAVIMVLGGALGVPRGIRVTTSLCALAGFVVLVTPGPSVLRAAVMAVIVVFSAFTGRPGRGVAALAAAVIALIIVDPWMSREYGFALSVLATGGLLLLAPPLARALAKRMPRALGTAIAIPLAAQLACQPVLLMLNPSVPLYGVAANLLAEPAAPLATVLGLIACLVTPIAGGVGFAFAQLAWLPSAWVAEVARVTSTLPASQLPWVEGVVGVVMMAAIVLAVILALRSSESRSRYAVKTAAIAVLLVFFAGYVGITAGSRVGAHLSAPADWQVAACDIGQGDAVLLHDGQAHGLVDVGPDATALGACLDELGIEQIDLLVLTHYDQDHVGGLAAVIGRVGTALVGRPTDAREQSRIDALVRGGADVRIAASGDHGTLGGLDWRVLWPSAAAHSMQTGNAGSVTVSFAGEGIRSIFLGDLGEHAQNALLASGRVQGADLVKVAHHGSADQSARLYQALHAAVGLVSVGSDNNYGHPTAKLLGILAQTGTTVFRTDLQGLILVAVGTDGRMRVWTAQRASAVDVRVPGDRDHQPSPGASSSG